MRTATKTTTEQTAEGPALVSETSNSAPAPRRGTLARTVIVSILALTALAAGGYLAYRFVFARPAIPLNMVRLSGRIEGDDSAVAPKVTGQDSGDPGSRRGFGQSGRRDRCSGRSATARPRAAGAALGRGRRRRSSSAQQQIAVLNDQLKQTELQTGQATLDAEGRVQQAEAQLSSAEAQLAQQESSLKLALYDRDAYTRLAKDGAVSERQGKQAQTTAETQEAARRGGAAECANRREPLSMWPKRTWTIRPIRTAQQAQIRKQIAQQEAAVASVTRRCKPRFGPAGRSAGEYPRSYGCGAL